MSSVDLSNNHFREILNRIQQRLHRDAFVHIDSVTFRKLLMWQGATERDMNEAESGKMHAAVKKDKEAAMSFRQIAFHRMVALD